MLAEGPERPVDPFPDAERELRAPLWAAGWRPDQFAKLQQLRGRFRQGDIKDLEVSRLEFAKFLLPMLMRQEFTTEKGLPFDWTPPKTQGATASEDLS